VSLKTEVEARKIRLIAFSKTCNVLGHNSRLCHCLVSGRVVAREGNQAIISLVARFVFGKLPCIECMLSIHSCSTTKRLVDEL
jgi:hypothetical protein